MSNGLSISQIAPHGKLRVAINFGNPVLASRHSETGEPQGVSVDIACRFAARLGVGMELITFESAGQSVQAVRSEQADLGFFAIDPLRGEGIGFTPPYVMIEGAYLVPEASAIQVNEDVDRQGIRVVVGKGSAYDLYLSRNLQNAEIVRAPTSPAVFSTFLEQRCEVAAGVRQQFESDIQHLADYRLLPGRFMVIYQAMGIPNSRDPQALEFLSTFLEEEKARGTIAELMAKHRIQGVAVAPAGYPADVT